MQASSTPHPTVAGMAADLAAGRASALELATDALARAHRHQGLGAYLALAEETALAEARAADARRARGEATPLTGISAGPQRHFCHRPCAHGPAHHRGLQNAGGLPQPVLMRRWWRAWPRPAR